MLECPPEMVGEFMQHWERVPSWEVLREAEEQAQAVLAAFGRAMPSP